MATFKFFNIGKANEEITRLENELATAQAESKAAKENAESVSTEAQKVSDELKQTNSDLATAKASIKTLTARAELAEKELKEAREKLANPNDQIKEAASRKALEITQAQGQPPLEVKPDASMGREDVIAKHAAIKDPIEKLAFYRKNKAAYDAAHRAANPGDFQLGPKQN